MGVAGAVLVAHEGRTNDDTGFPFMTMRDELDHLTKSARPEENL